MSYQQLADAVNNLAVKTTELTDQALLTQEESIAAKNAAEQSAQQAVASAAEAKASADVAANAVSGQLVAWALSQAFTLEQAVRNSDGAIITADIIWPDGTLGKFNTVVFNAEFPGAVDSWTATFISETALTVFQPTVTRDAIGAVVQQPKLTVTEE